MCIVHDACVLFRCTVYLLQVRFVLEEKGIPYKNAFVNLAGGETSSPWYMKTVNINGVVRLEYDVVNCFRQLCYGA